jgi:hypothetical protein
VPLAPCSFKGCRKSASTEGAEADPKREETIGRVGRLGKIHVGSSKYFNVKDNDYAGYLFRNSKSP